MVFLKRKPRYGGQRGRGFAEPWGVATPGGSRWGNATGGQAFQSPEKCP